MTYHKIYSFEKKIFNFKSHIEKLFNLDALEKMHENYEFDDKIKKICKDSHSSPHKIFYEKLNKGWPELSNLYKKYVKEFVLKILNKERIFYQTFPNFRISFPENVAVSTWHKDTDNQNLHPNGEINFFLPITKALDTNTLWVESKPDKKDFKPINLDYGEVFMFSGGDLMHGNKINKTGFTRVSFDFRVLPIEKFNPNHPYKTRTKNLAFKPGEYYSDTLI